MSKFVLLTIVSFFSSILLFGQASQVQGGSNGMLMFMDMESDETEAYERGAYTGKAHVLGDSITSLLDKVEYSYVYFIETGGAYALKEKNIEKAVIYASLNKVVRYYDKLLRKGKINEQKAFEDLIVILNNGISLKNYRTEGFELQLKEARNAEEMTRLFTKVKFTN
jgi:hypothetical protein